MEASVYTVRLELFSVSSEALYLPDFDQQKEVVRMEARHYNRNWI